ncbi:MAG: hypothetical protein ACRBFS_16645 [Aureispira sp.]
MMNALKLTSTFLLLTISSYSFGQFGGLIKKPKKPSISTPKIGKAKPKTSTSTATSSPAPVESNRNKDGTPKYDPENPTYKAYSNAKQNVKFTQSIMEGMEWKQNREKAQQDAAKYLAKAKKGLDFLNEQPSEEGQAYLKELNEKYTSFNAKCSSATAAFNKKKTYESNLKTYERWISYSNKDEDSPLEFTYQGFYKEVEHYKKEFPEAFEDGRTAQTIFKKLDNYFKKSVYKEVTKVEEEATVVMEAMYKQQLWEGHDNYKIEAKSYLRRLDQSLARIPSDDKLEDKTAAHALKAKITKETAMLKEYIESGQLEASLNQRKQERIDAVRLNKKAMSNSAYEKMAMDRTFTDGAKMLRAVIVSEDWQVVKNGLDIPKHKSLWYSIAIKDKDGVCYKASGELRRDYEGGGKYGSPKFLFSERDREMNCSNVNK